MANNPPPIPTKVTTVYSEFRNRRDGLLKALTTDFAELYELCDPEKENLNMCLWGLPNGKWEVIDVVEDLEVDPLQGPEPTVGINFRKGMQAKDWLSLVAIHSDSWLISIAFYFGALHRLDKNERNILFQMISDLPTLFEEVASNAKPEDQSATQSKSSEKTQSHKSEPIAEPVKDDESGEEEDDEDKAICGACEDISVNDDQFWICCDTCDKWFHGTCVKITPARAEHMKHYKCPGCSVRKGRA